MQATKDVWVAYAHSKTSQVAVAICLGLLIPWIVFFQHRPYWGFGLGGLLFLACFFARGTRFLFDGRQRTIVLARTWLFLLTTSSKTVGFNAIQSIDTDFLEERELVRLTIDGETYWLGGDWEPETFVRQLCRWLPQFKRVSARS